MKIKKEIEKLILKPNNVSIDDINKFEQEKWYRRDHLQKTLGKACMIDELTILKLVHGVKSKIVNLLNAKLAIDYFKAKWINNEYRGGKKPRKAIIKG